MTILYMNLPTKQMLIICLSKRLWMSLPRRRDINAISMVISHLGGRLDATRATNAHCERTPLPKGNGLVHRTDQRRDVAKHIGKLQMF